MICPSCGTENSEGAKFCNECATPLAVACASCGHPAKAGQKFCEECGSPLAAAGGAAASAGGSPVSASPPAPVPHEPAPVGASTELRMVSVLFVDLVGFTALSENREAEDVRELLGTYFERTRTIIERHGGTVEKFIGDAVMAVWGAPVAREDDAERAVRTALEIVDTVTAFGSEVGAPDLRARAGVVTGQVAALENPGEGLVVGDRVNTASRVQSAAQPGSVFVDEVTRQVTSAAIAFADGGEHAVKGKAEPLHLWRAVRVLGGVGGADREQGLDAGFVGRDADLRLVKELFHVVLERGSARLLAVTGEAGVGKSRLRREFLNYIDGLSSTVLWHSGRCLSHGEGVAYWALGEMVRQRLGIAEEASAAEARDKLDAGLERWVPELEDRSFIAPRLGALIGVAEPGLSREELFAGWRLFFERLADHEPVVLAFEDLQWADAGLLDFIEGLLDWSATSPIFILTLARPELSAGREGWPAGRRGATLIRLEPLDEADMRTLLTDLVEGMPGASMTQIVERAQGVPLYVVETVRELVDRGALVESDDRRLRPTGELGELEVPASLSALLSARIDALESAQRDLVKAMSVFGGSFPRSAAGALGDVPESELDPLLDGLVRKGVLVIRTDRLSPDRGQYAFAQELLRAVAYERLSRQERKPRHLAAAEHLQSAFPNEGEDVAEVIATHLLDAYRAATGDDDADELRERTLQALRRAARRAATVGAPEVAERSLRTAVELAGDDSERCELLEAAGEMARRSGRADAAIGLFDQAVAALRAAGRHVDVARVTDYLSRSLSVAGRAPEAQVLISEALETLGEDAPPDVVGSLNATMGRTLLLTGHHEDAGPPLETALSLATAYELPEVLCRSMASKAILYEIAGRVEEAGALYDRAVIIARRHDLSEALGNVEGNATNLRMQWDQSGALEGTEACVASARRRGDRYMESIQLGNLLQIHLLAGHWDEIDRIAAAVLDDSEPHPFEGFLQVPIGLISTLRGDLERARQALGALGEWVDRSSAEQRAVRLTLVVSLRLGEGAYEDAVREGRQMLSAVLQTDGPATEGFRFGWPDTVEAALRAGDADAAGELVELLEALPIGHVPPYLRAHLARGRARTNAVRGRHDTVEADLKRAIDGFRALAYPYWLAVGQTDLAEWLIEQGRGSQAEPLLAEAIPALEMLRAAPALTRAEGLSRLGSADADADAGATAGTAGTAAASSAG